MEKRLNLEKATNSLHLEEWKRWVFFMSQSIHYLKTPPSEVRVLTTMVDFDSNISDLENLAIPRKNVTVMVANKKEGDYVYQRGASVFEVSVKDFTVDAIARTLNHFRSTSPDKFPFQVLKLSWGKQLEPRVFQIASHLIHHYGADNMLFGLSCVPSTPKTEAIVEQTPFKAARLDELCNVKLYGASDRPPRAIEALRGEINLSQVGKDHVVKTIDLLPVLKWFEGHEHYVADGRRYRFVLDSVPELYSDFLVLNRHHSVFEPFSIAHKRALQYSLEDQTKEGFDRFGLEMKKVLGNGLTKFLKIRIPIGCLNRGLGDYPTKELIFQYHGTKKEIGGVEEHLRSLFFDVLDDTQAKIQQTLNRRTVTISGYDEVRTIYKEHCTEQPNPTSNPLGPEGIMTLKAYEALKPPHKKAVNWFHGLIEGYGFSQDQMEHLYEAMRKSRWYTYPQLREGDSLRAFLNDVRHFVALPSPDNASPKNILKYIGTEPRIPTHG